MSATPQVSVITIFFNAEAFLREAIDSVLAQTFPDWELVLVDDGSTDGSTAIAKAYRSRYPDQVRYFEHAGHRNLGKSTSRNLGLQKARGRYIAFLDADDVFLPQKLERQVALLEANPNAAMVYGRTQYWYSWTGKPKDKKRDVVSQLGLRAGRLFPPPFLMTRFLQDGGMVPCLCGLLVRHEVISMLGGFEESIQQLYEDQVFIAKVCLALPVFVEGGIGERYRQHPGSSSAAAIRSKEYHPLWPNPARHTFLRWVAEYVKEKKIHNRALERTLRGQLRPYRYPRLYCFLNPLRYLSCLAHGYLRSVGHKLQGAVP
ncbi:MAG: glycosyltransferase family A protein [Thermodesulfobacteriota bacterium]|jgi:glycosyltransferase involved in cell wall biosynthesis